MGCKSHSRSLLLWANGVRVGRWTPPARGEPELQYDVAWVRSPQGRPLSLSLPFTLGNEPHRGQRVENCFDNLLPESQEIRKRVATRFKTGSMQPFELLRAIGRESVGAVQLPGEHEQPQGADRIEGEPVDDEAIERHLLDGVAPARFDVAAANTNRDDFRISLAGAQEQDAFLWWNGRWHKPRGATPTTHIFKLPLGRVGGRQADFSTAVDNEWLCLRLLKAYGLPVADAEIRHFGKQRVLVVERFDRQLSGNRQCLLRLPQEDFCQVEGLSPLLKYESDGGPGLRQLFSTLKQSERAEQDQRTLMAAQILFWLLRAPDGHAKNFSIQILPQGKFQLTRLYDVMSAYPTIGAGPNQWAPREVRLAMALLGKDRHCHVHAIQRRHFNSTARQVGYASDAEELIQALLARTPAAVEQVRAEMSEGFSGRVAASILRGLQQAARALEAMPAG
ncbi:MAG: type II toxin-antitoxin system HipA family toxin [Rubrivivax sp.]|nr:type II toxin-antitoxin system HipA family toxin [Rubrivivax sp.]